MSQSVIFSGFYHKNLLHCLRPFCLERSILVFIEAKDGGGGDNCSYKTYGVSPYVRMRME